MEWELAGENYIMRNFVNSTYYVFAAVKSRRTIMLRTSMRPRKEGSYIRMFQKDSKKKDNSLKT
jgi:hypothetical protein